MAGARRAAPFRCGPRNPVLVRRGAQDDRPDVSARITEGGLRLGGGTATAQGPTDEKSVDVPGLVVAIVSPVVGAAVAVIAG